LARLLVKVAALVIIAAALMELPQTILRLIEGTRRTAGLESVGLAFTPVSVSLLGGLAMFLWAGPIVDRTLVSGPAEKDAEAADLSGFEEIALTVLGVYVLTAGLAELVYYWAQWGPYYDLVIDDRAPRIAPRQFAGLLAGATRILIGVILVLFSRGFVAFKRRLLALRPLRRDQPVGAAFRETADK
jgi:hypothetical protein